MGLFGSRKNTEVVSQDMYGIEDDSTYAEMFGTTGITEDQDMVEEEFEDKLFYEALDFCSSPQQNMLPSIQRGTLSKDEFFKKMEVHLKEKTQDELLIDRILNRLEKYIWGYHIIEDYINDDSISDIKILDEYHIRLKKNGKRISAPVKFKDAEDYKRFVDIICSRNKITLSDINAIQTFTDQTSNDKARLRFNLTSGILNVTGKPYVHIRKVLKEKKTLQQLQDADMFPPELMKYFKNKAKTSSGIVFTGKGASGKTTLMNAMLDEIPEDKSALVIQENDELFSNHPDMMFQHVIANRGESKIQYDLKSLATNGLLTDLDYFIIGEIKGGEAAYFMNAAYTGHQCWTSVHGVNSKEAINKLTDYVKYATDYSREDVLRMLRFMNIVIFMKDYKVEEISKITGFDETKGELIYEMVYKRGEFSNV